MPNPPAYETNTIEVAGLFSLTGAFSPETRLAFKDLHDEVPRHVQGPDSVRRELNLLRELCTHEEGALSDKCLLQAARYLLNIVRGLR
jgi:hypothetical protein